MPIVETARLRLRPFRPADLDALAAIYADPVVMRWMRTGLPVPRNQTEEAIAWYIGYWAAHGCGQWAVEQQADGALVGRCGLFGLDQTDEIEVGYLLGQPYWGQGDASEAAEAALRWGFTALGLERIVGVVRPENVASQRVLEKIGLRYERLAHHYNLDLYYYGLDRAAYTPPVTPYAVYPAPTEEEP